MKKLIAVLLFISLVSTFSVLCFAETVTDIPNGQSGDVYAKYDEEIDGVYKQKLQDSDTLITLPDGTKITVSEPGDDEGLTLVIIPVYPSDTEAYDWIVSCLGSGSENIFPMYIYIEDQDGNKVEPTGKIDVTVDLPEGYDLPSLSFLSKDNTVSPIISSVSDGNVSFSFDSTGYYIMTKDSKQAADTEQTDTTVATDKDVSTPKTGDCCNLSIWSILLLASGSILTTAGIRKRIKKK